MATGAIRRELSRSVVWIGRGGIIAVVTAVAGIRRIIIVTVVAGSTVVGNSCVCPV